MPVKHIHVAVGVILDSTVKSLQPMQVYLTRRAADVHQGGKWEFPGGKVECGETTFLALQRELHEEIGIVVNSSEHLMDIRHDYGDKQVWLDIHVVSDFSGEPYGKEGQLGQWFALSQLAQLDFPEANQPILDQLLNQFTI
ncbi:MAG: 8-oxo-dGTP diphosphatase MutT [Glaciecola sp.]|nr:8-oxo-dGTP diphosphatase MutT [Glaciecola sp.]MDG1815772.1 8-oxo-dGTP diphosphatase MutT [Glaciecola sp.]MDG2099072.1 8-oxo-dGTP diphosphatase MutT [Glaciecola sp.]